MKAQVTRRAFLGCAAAFASGALVTEKAFCATGLPVGTEPTVDGWFSEIVSKPPAGALQLHRFPDSVYALLRKIDWVPPGERASELQPVSVPKGFTTDFASIPRIFWAVLPRDGRYAYPAVIHDYLYWIQDRPRAEADDVFRVSMEEFGLDWATINAVYWGVRAGGASAWSANAALKSKGDKRVLARLPSDPTITWESWRLEANVFR